MADIINAKCFGCGKIIRVPASLGGRNAKCPGCGHIFTIPKPADSTMEIVGDEQLPAVATDEILEGEVQPPPPPVAPARSDEESAVRRGVGVKRAPGRREGGPRRPVAAKKSAAPLILGIVGILAVLGVVIGVAASRGGKKDEKKDPAPARTDRAFTQEEIALTNRARDFIGVFHSGNLPAILEFFDDKAAARTGITQLLEQATRYENIVWNDPSVSGTEGSISFTCSMVRAGNREDGKAISTKWKKSGDAWRLAEVPK